MPRLRVLLVGGLKHGGNCLGLARGFRDRGHAAEIVPHEHPGWRAQGGLTSRAVQRLAVPWQRTAFNRAILSAAGRFQPHIAVVYKGTLVAPSTLERLRREGVWVVNVYPDNSVRPHRHLDPAIFREFDHVFHTKRFGVDDFRQQFGVTNITYLPHGFDPYVHRPFDDPHVMRPWSTDVSFIGTWSPHKAALLSHLQRALRPGQLRIWGQQWLTRPEPMLADAIVNRQVTGDSYALAVSASQINLGLLSERRAGASSDDLITSRTFHIPACGGFLLHQRTPDVLECFTEGEEIACFDTADELVAKVRHYLTADDERRRIAQAGYRRCVAQHSLAHRTDVILETYMAATASGREREGDAQSAVR